MPSAKSAAADPPDADLLAYVRGLRKPNADQRELIELAAIEEPSVAQRSVVRALLDVERTARTMRRRRADVAAARDAGKVAERKARNRLLYRIAALTQTAGIVTTDPVGFAREEVDRATFLGALLALGDAMDRATPEKLAEWRAAGLRRLPELDDDDAPVTDESAGVDDADDDPEAPA